MVLTFHVVTCSAM